MSVHVVEKPLRIRQGDLTLDCGHEDEHDNGGEEGQTTADPERTRSLTRPNREGVDDCGESPSSAAESRRFEVSALGGPQRSKRADLHKRPNLSDRCC